MGQERSKFSTGMCFNRSKVVDLAQFRRTRHSKGPLAFYLTENNHWGDVLRSLEMFQVEEINSWERLSSRLLLRSPEIVLVESNLEWECPLQLIRDTQRLLQVPIVFLCDRNSLKEDKDLVKKAYAAGVSDTLYTPLEKQELFEALNVLIKFQKQISTQG